MLDRKVKKFDLKKLKYLSLELFYKSSISIENNNFENILF